jgi:dUTP pyrophosphatase
MIEVGILMKPGFEDLMPRKAHDDDAGYDIRAADSVEVDPGDCVRFPTGMHVVLPVGYEAQIRTRSGLAWKRIKVANSPGTVDAGYRGEVGILLHNQSDTVFKVNRGDRIAQMVICKLPEVKLVPISELPPTERGAGGFGHTGIK